MKKFRTTSIWAALLMLASFPAVAQTMADESKSQEHPDAAIQNAMQQVSAKQLAATIDKLVSFHTRNTLSVGMPAASGKGVLAAREWIRSEFERYSKDCGGCLEVKEDVFTESPTERIPKPTEIGNVYAILHGNNPANAHRMVLISGHYDSRATDVKDIDTAAPGANDDGSGVAAVLESARVLSKLKMPATIVFLAVAGEEQGLNGSRHFAQMARVQGWTIEAALNNDTVGGDKSPGQDTTKLRVFSEGLPLAATPQEWKTIRSLGGENDSASRQVARYVAEISRIYMPPKGLQAMMIFRADRFLRGGDHTSFNEAGFPAVRLTEFRENYDRQHQNPRTENGIEYGDLPKFVDFEYLANVTRLNVATLASLASAPAPPAHVKLLTKNLENDSNLAWDASPGGLASGYEVLWRWTTSATWDGAESVGNVTHATLKRSKDNVIFGVRSVDAKGHRSLAVVPAPER